MRHDSAGFLSDVLDAIVSIESFLVGVDEAAFVASDLIRAAVERKFIIIGEALSQLSKEESSDKAAIAEFQKIVGFRHQLVHGYRLIDARRVFTTAKIGLPGLKAEVMEILQRLK